MQFIVISHQILEFCLGMVLGLLLGGIYDILRFLRTFFKNVKVQIFAANILDIIFAAFCGAVYSIFIYHFSNGRFRWFTAISLMLGYLLYYVGPSKLIRPVLYWISDLISALFKLLAFPFKSVFNKLRLYFLMLYIFIKNKRQINYTRKLKWQLYDCVKLWDDGDYL